ncbi:unnamed protein product [Debaryomyces tyrocola]|nr:unnamed protein product [Debaryomyces tyrocola]
MERILELFHIYLIALLTTLTLSVCSLLAIINMIYNRCLKLQDWENILRITLSQLINDGYVGGKVTVLPSDKSFEILLKLGLALEPKVLEEEYINSKTMKLRETILNEI